MSRYAIVLLWTLFNVTLSFAQIDAPTSSLLSACQSNNLTGVQETLTQGADVNAKDHAGFTPLLYAVSANNLQITELLLEKGANLNVNDPQGRCPVVIAVQSGKVQLLKKLAAAGGDLPHRHIFTPGDVQTPLHIAVQNEDLSMAKYLLSEKVSTETRNIDGESALMLAAGTGNLEMVKLLIDNGAYLYATRGHGGSLLDSEIYPPPPPIKRYLQQLEQTRLSTFVEPAWTEVLKMHKASGQLNHTLIEKYLLDGGDPYGQDKDGRTLLHHIAGLYLSNSDLLESLLEVPEIDVNVVDIHGMTPLHIACKENRANHVKTLLEYGADMNMRDQNGWTPLLILARFYYNHSGKEELKVAQMLLDNGADVNATDTFGKTPLLCLSEANMDKHLGFARLLIKHGADVNRQNYTGNTFLHGASEMGTVAMMKLAIEAGANLNIRNYYGRSILDVVRYDRQDKIDLFFQYINDVTIQQAIYYSQVNILDQLLAQGADINMVTDYDNGATGLIIATKQNDLKMTKKLLELGAAIDIQDTLGSTALHYAARYGHDNIVIELLDSNADVNLVNKEGWRAIDLAGSNNRYRVIQLFKDRYPDMDVSKKPKVVQEVTEQSDSETQVEIEIPAQELSEEEMQAMMTKQEDIIELIRSKAPDLEANPEKFAITFETPEEPALDPNQIEAQIRQAEHNWKAEAYLSKTSKPLHRAVIQGKKDTVKKLLVEGADVHEIDEVGILSLNYAVLMENRQMIILLLENGADINRLDSNVHFGNMTGVLGFGHTVGEEAGWGAIHYATVFSSKEILEFLVSKDANVNLADIEHKESPIFATIDVDRPEMLKALVNAGADLSFRNKQGKTILHSMASRGKIDYIKLLLELGADVDMGKPDKTPLMSAARAGKDDAMIFLLENGANINALNKKAGDIISSLLPASYTTETLRILIEYGIDINAKNSKGQPPLFCLFNYGGEMKKGLRDNVQLLLDAELNVNATDEEGNTVLHYAASRCSLELAQMMITHGADINATNSKGKTPFDIMLGPNFRNSDYDDLFRLLGENNTHLNELDRYGRNALHNAVIEDSPDQVRFLASKGVDIENRENDMQGGKTPLHTAVSNGHIEVVEALLELGADVSALDKQQQIPLFTAVYRENLEITKLLLDAGADVSALDNQQQTPLFTAVRKENLEIIQLLLDYKADCDVQNKYKVTPLHEAILYGKKKAVKLLLDAGARTDIPNRGGLTAPELAQQLNKSEIAALFQ